MRSPSPCSKSSSPSPLISNVTSASAQSVSLSQTLRPSRIPQCVTPRTPALTTCVYILGISVCAHTWWGRNHRHEDGRRSTCHTRRGQIHVRHALTDSARPSSTPHGCCAHAGPHRCQKRRPGSKPTPPPNRRKNANMAALVPCSAASRSQPHQRLLAGRRRTSCTTIPERRDEAAQKSRQAEGRKRAPRGRVRKRKADG